MTTMAGTKEDIQRKYKTNRQRTVNKQTNK